MPIRIRHRDKNGGSAQQADISLVMTNAMPFFAGVLYGACSGVWGIIRINLNNVGREDERREA